MTDVGTAWVAIKPAVKGFGSDLAKQTGSEVDGAGKGIGAKFGTALKLGIAGAAIGGVAALGVFTKKAIDAAGQARKVAKLTEAVIKSTGGVAKVSTEQVEENAQSIANRTGVEKDSIQSGENMLLTFKNIRNEQGKGNDIFNQTTQTLVDMSAVMGSEPKRAAIQLGKALNDPIKGVSALSRVGVTFTDQQKAQIKTMVDSGHTMDAQKMILKELGSEFGGAAESQATSGAKLKVAMTQLEVTVGTALLPAIGAVKTALTQIILWINGRVAPTFSILSTYTKGLGDAFNTWVTVLFSAKGATGGITQGVDALGSSLNANLLPVLSQLAQFFQGQVLPTLIAVGAYLLTKFVPIFNAVANIVAHQLLPIYRMLATFILGQFLPAVMAIVKSVAQSLKPAFDQLFKSLAGLMPTINQLLAKFKQYLPVLLKVALIVLKVVGFLLKLVAVILGKVLPVVIRLAAFLIKVLVKAIIVVVVIIGTLIKALIAVGRAFGVAGRAVGEWAKNVAKGVTSAVKFIVGIDKRILNAVSGFATLLIHAGEALIDGLIKGITNKLSALGSKMGEVAKKVKGFLPGSPVKEGPLTSWNRKSPGSTLVERIAEGLGGTAPVDRAMAALAGRVALAGGGAGLGAVSPTGGATGGPGGLHGTRLRLVVDGREFNAYVDERADAAVDSARDLRAERGRAAWSR
jgi:hypothetical protein